MAFVFVITLNAKIYGDRGQTQLGIVPMTDYNKERVCQHKMLEWKYRRAIHMV